MRVCVDLEIEVIHDLLEVEIEIELMVAAMIEERKMK